MSVIDSLFWEIGIDPEAAAKIDQSATQIETSGEKIAAAAQTAEDAVTQLVEELLKTPDGVRQVEQVLQRLTPPLDDVAAGMTYAASSTARWQEGLRALSLQQADAAARTAALNAPLDQVAGGMTRAASGAAKWEQGLRNLAAQQAETTTLTGQQTVAHEGAVHGMGKVTNALTTLAFANTDVSTTQGKLIEGLLLMGAGSAVVTGIAAGAALIVAVYRKVTEEARLTKEAADAAGKAIAESLKTPVGEALGKVADLTAQITALEAKAATPVVTTGAGRAGAITTGGLTAAEQAQLDQLRAQRGIAKKELDDARRDQANAFADQLKQLQTEERALVQAIRARETEGLNTEALRQQLADVRGILAQVQAAAPADRGRLTEELKAQVAARRGALEQVRQGLIQRFTAVLPQTLDDTAAALEQLTQKLADAHTPAEEIARDIAPLITRLNELRDAAAQVQLDQALQLGPEQAQAALDEIRARLVAQLPKNLATSDISQQTDPGVIRILTQIQAVDVAREKVAKQLVADYKAQADAAGEVLYNTGQGNAAALKHKKTVGEIARELADVARGALGIAEAFGVVNDHTALVLQNVVNITDALPDVVSQLGNLGKTIDDIPAALGGISKFDFSSFASSAAAVLGGLAPIISGILGDNAKEREDRRLREENTQAIHELTKVIADQVTGADVGTAEKAVQALRAAPAGSLTDPTGTFLNRKKIDALLAQFGLNLTDLEAQLKAINPNLNLNTTSAKDFADSLKLVQQALAEVQFKAFAESFQGQLAFLQARANLLDLKNPIDQLKAIQDVAKGKFGSPALTKALEGLDLTTTAGREQATQNLLGLLDQLNTPGGLKGSDLGGLSSQQLLDLINQIGGLISQINSGTASSGGSTTNFTAENRITETTGGRLAGLAESQLAVQKDILAALTGGGGLIPAPPVRVNASAAGAAGSAGSVTVSLGGITIQFLGPVGDPRGITDGLSATLTAQIDRALGVAIQRRQAQLGVN